MPCILDILLWHDCTQFQEICIGPGICGRCATALQACKQRGHDEKGFQVGPANTGDEEFVIGVSCVNGEVWLITYNNYTDVVEFVFVELD